jgi:septum formation protein
MAKSTVILASTSPTRQKLLMAAGLKFAAHKPRVDEKKLQQDLAGTGSKGMALELASAKATSLTADFPDAVVIGADQTLEFQGAILHKATSLTEARHQLGQMLGDTHLLHSAVVCASRDGVLFRHVDTASLTMRRASAAFLDDYLAGMGERVLHTVGSYEFEGAGIQLFEKVEGDFHTILGLPLLPLLAFLRSRGIMPE